MSLEQLPAHVREFVDYLHGLLARLDQGGGWCAVFWQRDPDGMQACLDGREVPPWDVVEALLHDLAAQYGPGGADPETERARALHAAALAAYDARPDARDALGDRLDVMLREQRYAAERHAELGRLLASATTREQADAIRLDLAWARDDHERATARCAELRERMAGLDARPAWPDAHHRDADMVHPRQPADRTAPAGVPAAPVRPDAHGIGTDTDRPTRPTEPADRATAARAPASPAWADAHPAPAHEPTDTSGPDPKKRKRRRGGARFAGIVEEEAAPLVVPPSAAPTLPAQPATPRRTPRGARFAGAAAEVPVVAPQPRVEPMGEADRKEVARTVEALVGLRAEGRSGEAHALLAEAAYWPSARFPVLAAAMERAGLGADWATLLWEAASLPAERLVAAADALTAAGRTEDGEQILRQGVARPATEIGQAVAALAGEGREREVRALLAAYVSVRTPEEAARSAAPDPKTLVPLLLEAARGVSDERRWDLVHALRVAGFTA
ncbi:hypothetical protein ACFYNL_29315 [Streptomyces sp. NPDC007808]|uniref:hypothetical protein n=1 Tax=Streptomyces sp. NPDC007808 TaxID=3364779 RepID=UPI0036755173